MHLINVHCASVWQCGCFKNRTRDRTGGRFSLSGHCKQASPAPTVGDIMAAAATASHNTSLLVKPESLQIEFAPRTVDTSGFLAGLRLPVFPLP